MKLEEIKEKQIGEFREFMERLKNVESSILNLLKDEEDKKDQLEDEYRTTKITNERIRRLEIEAEKKLDHANSVFRESRALEASCKEQSQKLKDRELKLNERQEAIVKESGSFDGMRQDLEKREKWIEIEERRLLYIDKKLKILAEDKEISQKLKELE